MAPSQDKPENNKISEQKFQKKPAHPDTITPGVHWRVVQKKRKNRPSTNLHAK